MTATELLGKIQDEVEDAVSDVIDALPASVVSRLEALQTQLEELVDSVPAPLKDNFTKLQDQVNEVLEDAQKLLDSTIDTARDSVPEPVTTGLGRVQETINDGWSKLSGLVPVDKLPTPASVVDDSFGAARNVLDAQHRLASKLVGGEGTKPAPKAVKATKKATKTTAKKKAAPKKATKTTAKKAPAKKAPAKKKATAAKK